MELNLTGVEMAEGYLPVSGGMRLGFTPREDDPVLPELHAGDEVSALVEGRLPLVYRDPGAFNRRDFLARQDIHVLATLRASALLEKTGTAAPSLYTRVAGCRGILRDRLDGMRILRTDQNGAVKVRTDGHTLWVSCFVGCPAEGVALGKTQKPNQEQADQQ